MRYLMCCTICRTLYCSSCSLCRTPLHDWSLAHDVEIASHWYCTNSIDCPSESISRSKWHAWLASRCPGRCLSTWQMIAASCPTLHSALCGQLTFWLAWCCRRSAVTATELLQLLDLTCGTLFRSSWSSNPDITYGLFIWQLKGHLYREAWKHEQDALWLLICGALGKHFFTYLLLVGISPNLHFWCVYGKGELIRFWGHFGKHLQNTGIYLNETYHNYSELLISLSIDCVVVCTDIQLSIIIHVFLFLFFFPVMLYYSYTLMFSLFYSIVAVLLCVVLFAPGWRLSVRK